MTYYTNPLEFMSQNATTMAAVAAWSLLMPGALAAPVPVRGIPGLLANGAAVGVMAGVGVEMFYNGTNGFNFNKAGTQATAGAVTYTLMGLLL